MRFLDFAWLWLTLIQLQHSCIKTLVVTELLKHLFVVTAIDVDAADIKALYRRCQALEKLGKLDMAFKDVQRCATLEPKNKTFLETLRRLGAEIQQKVRFPSRRSFMKSIF